MGLGGIVMPGTLRDSLGILDAVFNLDGPARPEIVITEPQMANSPNTRSL